MKILVTERMDASALCREGRLLRRSEATGGVGGYAEVRDQLRLSPHLVRGPRGSQRRPGVSPDQGTRHLQSHGGQKGERDAI